MKKMMHTLAVIVLVLALAACSLGNSTSAVTSSSVSSASTTNPASSVTSTSSGDTVTAVTAEMNTAQIDPEELAWDGASATAIVLSGDSITINGDGATVEDSRALISQAGTYVISGSLTDGQIVVDTESDELVQLVLDGANITCSDSAPIDILQGKSVAIILADGSANSVSDGTTIRYDDEAAQEPSAAIFSNGDLSFSGNGSLVVNANANDGISSDDGIVIAGGDIQVIAVDDGIRGKEYLVVEAGALSIVAGGDGLKSDFGADSDETGETDKGYILIQSGKLQVEAGGDALSAQTTLLISGGEFDIVSGSSVLASNANSGKGIKGTLSVIIDGGAFSINAADDAIHSNGSIVINDGEFTISSGDDGLHADEALTINAGSIQIVKSYEGLESAAITLNDGNVQVVASDDGINVAGGVDGSGMNDAGQGGPQDMFAAAGDYLLTINGGMLAVDAGGDGLDSNGTILMSGGTVLVNGPTNDGNGALDHFGFTISGGTLVAAGSSGMAQAPDESSSQCALLIYFTASLPAGTPVHIENSAGEEVLTFIPSKQFSSLAFSSPNLLEGETYTIYTGGSSGSEATYGLVQGGEYSGGTVYTPFTVSSTLTTVGSGGRGGGRMGGRRP